jgi:hypothetical protein
MFFVLVACVSWVVAWLLISFCLMPIVMIVRRGTLANKVGRKRIDTGHRWRRQSTTRTAQWFTRWLPRFRVEDVAKKLKRKNAFAGLLIFLLALSAVIGLSILASHRPGRQMRRDVASVATVNGAERGKIEASLAALPLKFELNQGQAEPNIKFISRGNGYTLFLSANEALFALQKRGFSQTEQVENVANTPAQSNVAIAGLVNLKFSNANPAATLSGEEPLSEHINYLHGRNPANFQMNVPTFGRVRYKEMYPGVDLVYYGNQQRLEYDFELSAGADPGAIRLNYDGADALDVNREGDLVLQVGGETMTQHKPIVYQNIGGLRREVVGEYVKATETQVGFQVGPYDKNEPLVIDPVLSYAAHPPAGFINGDMKVDANGNVYYTGVNLLDFSPQYGMIHPTPNAFQATNHSVPYHGYIQSEGIFVKLSVTATGELHPDYATYFGGVNDDWGRAIQIDDQGNAYIAGFTNSPDFPITDDALQAQLNKGIDDNTDKGTCCLDSPHQDAFVMKFGSPGNLIYSTFIGGSSSESGRIGLGLDGNGAIYIAGATISRDLPVTADAYSTSLSTYDSQNQQGKGDLFVAKLSPGGGLTYCSYLGGPNGEEGLDGLAVDSGGNMYLTGFTSSQSFPLTDNALQRVPSRIFILKFNPSLAGQSGLLYSTMFGADSASPQALAIDNSGNIYIAGLANSCPTRCSVPVTSGALQTTPQGGADGFVAKINPSGTAATSLVYATYLGGSGADNVRAIAVDSSGNAYVGGNTYSPNFPVTAGAFQTSYGGGIQGGIAPPIGGDAFLAKIDSAGSSLVSFTYLGGTQPDNLYAMTRDTNGNIYLAGDTASPNFPFINNDTTGKSAQDFIVKIGPMLGLEGLSSPNAYNPLSDANNFVRQQYLDFLSREPDHAGLVFWGDQISQCGTDAACIDQRKVELSAAFYMSDEFQRTGYFVHRLYKASYGRMPSYIEFTPDRRKIVGGANLAASKIAFANEWVSRDIFLQSYPVNMSTADFVNSLYDNAGLVPFTAERQEQIAAMAGGRTRAEVLRNAIETPAFKASEYNRAFVLIQYFGYLRRNGDQSGLDFWIDVLNNRDPNNYYGMVRAFLTSVEYQDRFATVPAQ